MTHSSLRRPCPYFPSSIGGAAPDGAQKYSPTTDTKFDSNGLVHAPTNLGLGAEIDFELIKR